MRDFVTGRRSTKSISNGASTGYGFIAFLAEGELDSFKAVAPASVGSSMVSTPQIGGSGKRGSGGSRGGLGDSGKKPLPSLSGCGETLSFLERMKRTMTLENQKFEIDQLRYQISTEEGSLLNHKDILHGDRKEMRDKMKRLKEEGCTEEEVLVNEGYNMAYDDFEEGKQQITAIQARHIVLVV